MKKLIVFYVAAPILATTLFASVASLVVVNHGRQAVAALVQERKPEELTITLKDARFSRVHKHSKLALFLEFSVAHKTDGFLFDLKYRVTDVPFTARASSIEN